MNWIEDELDRIRKSSLHRERTLMEGLIDFCSNDYLGLRKHPKVIEASTKALREFGLGSGASQLVSGYTKLHRTLEEKLAEFKGTERCVLFGSGYLANLGTIPVLAGEGDLILSDELNHASLIDGCRFSKAHRAVFRHRDYEHLEELLSAHRKNFKKALIVTDSVFSMDGDIADLRRLYRISQEYECMLYVDDAHGTGTIGRGKGALEEFSLNWREDIVVMGTLSKALGSYGAFVCGSKELVELLTNRARTLIFTTSLPPSVCAGAIASLELIEENPGLINSLRLMEEKLLSILKPLPYEIKFHRTPIIPILIGSERETLRVSKHLRSKGIFIQAIRYPTVPKGKARLRLTASLNYTDKELTALGEALEF